MQFNKIAIQFLYDDYCLIADTLPIGTYRQHRKCSLHKGYVLLVYELKHAITSSKQLLWLANIKEYMKKSINKDFEFIEIDSTENMETSNIKYTLQELQSYFKSFEITYPKIRYANSKDQVYKNLCQYATRLYYNNILSLEIIMGASIKMNDILNKPFSYKELLKKSRQAYDLICRSKDDLTQRLSKRELKTALKKGGNIRAIQKQSEQQRNIKNIIHLIDSGEYNKPNGKPNISTIATKLNLTRQTVSKLFNQNIKKSLLCILPYFFIYTYLFNTIQIDNTRVYHNTIAKVTLLEKSLYLKGLQGYKNI